MTPNRAPFRLALAATALGALAVAADTPPVARAATAGDLAWLAGCWQSVGRESGSGEQWTAPAGGTLLGVGRTVEGGRTTFHEFLQIRETAAGGLEYVALPSGQPEAAFQLVSLSADELVFENPAHDFPQRIAYRRAGPDHLVARIEGRQGGEPRGVDFPLRREPCPGASPP